MASVERKQVLIADDETNLRRVLAAQLTRDGYDVHVAEDGAAALELLEEHHIDVLITDLRMPRVDGLGVLRHVQAKYPEIPVIIITAHGTVDTAVEALKMGAFDYVTKPFDRMELRAVIAKAARTRELGEREVADRSDGRELRQSDGTEAVRPQPAGKYRLIGQADSMLEVYGVIEKVADTPSTVLITGESGTGKELIARALHDNSRRKDKPLIRVNCAAIPHELIESELFGYEKGAFTGAVTSKPGRFELAHGGTLFLDEIGEIPINMQVKLLRAVQEQEFERVGGVRTLRVDVRLIVATNRNLETEIAAGRFREDLYYRVKVVHIALPPLRERRADIPLLVDHFIGVYSARLRKPVVAIDQSAMDALLAYSWRGNIRELENVIERCMLFAEGTTIGLEDLPPEVRRGSEPGTIVTPDATVDGDGGLKDAVREATAKLERELILRALKQTSNNVTHTARLLKISRKGLQTKMKELGLRDPMERVGANKE